MERRIRRLGIFMLLCFLALFVQLNNIQVFKSNALANSPQNPHVLAVKRSQTRGSILSSDGVILASSTLAPRGSIYKYQRVYNPFTASLFAHVVGYDSPLYGNFNGVEAQYNNYLTPHTRPARTLRDLLVNRTEFDNVTLTMDSKLQQQVATALNQGAPNQLGAAAVVLNPTTGAIEAMYSNPSFDPNPLVSQNLDTERAAWFSYLAQSQHGNPLRAGAYNEVYPPGSSFKVITTSAVLEHRPDLAQMNYPVVSSITLPDTGNPPQTLHNYAQGSCGGNLMQLLVQSCDADFASVGQLLGAQGLVTQAQLYGFNQRVPLDVPASTVARSNFGTVAGFATDLPGLMKSAIGQDNVTAYALQMAMVAGTVANGGIEMTPHVMSEIRSSQGNLVQTYQPKPWMQAISTQTASTLTSFMQGVVSSGTAAGVFPASWNVAAKTGTAEVGPNLQQTTDWLIAFAPTATSKVAVAVVVPNQGPHQTGAGIAGPIVRQILGDVLADQKG